MKTDSESPEPTRKNEPAPSMAALIHAEFLYSRIPAHVRDSLPLEQRQEVLNAFLTMTTSPNSPFKFEAVFPFFFRRYYLLLLFGRDRRRSTSNAEHVRRERVPMPIRSFMYMALLGIVLASFVITLFMGIYLLKSYLGIDLFPNQHLKDFFNMFVDWIS